MTAAKPTPKKNPRRVAAGRRNRRKRGPYTAADRETRRKAIMKRRPWEHSTGPRTAEGKKQAAQNGKRCKTRPLSKSEVHALTADAAALARRIAALRRDLEGKPFL